MNWLHLAVSSHHSAYLIQIPLMSIHSACLISCPILHTECVSFTELVFVKIKGCVFKKLNLH